MIIFLCSFIPSLQSLRSPAEFYQSTTNENKQGQKHRFEEQVLKSTCLDLVTIFCWILSLILLKTETVGNEFPNLQFYRAVCFTAADPAEGAQGNEGNELF